MRHYFTLQLTLVNRHISDFGLRPVLGYVLAFVLFIGLSAALFLKTSFAQYLYLLALISVLLNLGERSRNEFLKSCFKDKAYIKIRLLENAIVALPFALFLVYEGCYLAALAATFGAAILAFLQLKLATNFTLPTPFYRWPFEFTVGFRKTFYLHLFAYFLTLMSVLVDNFNLGIFSLLLVMLVCLTYYSELETDYYIWIHAQKPKGFLGHKIKTALIYSSILSLPIIVSLCGFYPHYAHIILGFQLLGYCYLTAFILAKYSAFPHQMGLPQSIVLAICFTMPPLLLLVIPMFYRQSTKKLNRILP